AARRIECDVCSAPHAHTSRPPVRADSFELDDGCADDEGASPTQGAAASWVYQSERGTVSARSRGAQSRRTRRALRSSTDAAPVVRGARPNARNVGDED